MKKGLIVINAYADLQPVRYQTERLLKEFEKLGIAAHVKRCGEVLLAVDEAAKEYDFCVYLDKDKYLSQLLEAKGLRLFNSHAAVQACDDKMQTQILLESRGVPMPKAIAAPLCYTLSATPDEKFLNGVEKKLGYPIIVKGCYGSRGEAVFKAENRAELDKLAKKLLLAPHLYQACVKESLGKDLRVILVGGKVVAAMRRISNGDFRSNIELGGRGEKIEIDEDLKLLCEKVSNILNLDYCGVDVLCGKNGYFICEVNSNAFFGGIESVTGENVAKAYAEHINGVIYGI